MTASAPLAPKRRHRFLGALAVACVALQFPGTLWLSSVALAAWLMALAALDRAALRRLWRPRFLLFSAAIALLSGLLLGPADARVIGVPISSRGVEAGGLMLVRGALIFGLTSWLAGRLAVGGLRWRSSRRPGGNLGTAVTVAIRLVPDLTARLQQTWSAHRSGRNRLLAVESAAVDVLYHAVTIADGLVERREGVLPPTGRDVVRLAVIGSRESGKTTTLKAVRDLLVASGVSVGGVVQPADHEGLLRIGYKLEDVADGTRRPFATRLAGAEVGGCYSFDPSGWEWAAERIRAARRYRDVLVVDELGRIEADGGGHVKSLVQPVEKERGRVWLLGVREDTANRVQERLGLFAEVLPPTANADELKQYANRVLSALRAREENVQ